MQDKAINGEQIGHTSPESPKTEVTFDWGLHT
jgi:hypothetical protein